MEKRHKFAKWVFIVAGVYGLAALLPQYFLEDKLGRDFPPPVTHPEHFYGFIGIAIAWQVAFLLMASDVQRYRPFMLVAVLEKISFGVAALLLYSQKRVASAVVGFGMIDLVLAVLFVAAFWACAPEPKRV